MKEKLRYYSVILFLIVTLSSVTYASSNYIIDDAKLFENSESLQEELQKFYLHTEVDPFIVTTNNLNGNTMEEYADKFYTKMFQDGNHLLILIYVKEEDSKLQITSGYALKYFLNKEVLNPIVEKVNPYFTSKKYEEGVISILEEISKEIKTTSGKNYHDVIIPETMEEKEKIVTTAEMETTTLTPIEKKETPAKEKTIATNYTAVLIIVIFAIAVMACFAIYFVLKYCKEVNDNETEIEKERIKTEREMAKMESTIEILDQVKGLKNKNDEIL